MECPHLPAQELDQEPLALQKKVWEAEAGESQL